MRITDTRPLNLSSMSHRHETARQPATLIRVRDPVWPPAVTRALALEAVFFVMYAVYWWAVGPQSDVEAKAVLLGLGAIALGIQSSAMLRFGEGLGLNTTFVSGARKYEVPSTPVLSMREIAHDPALRASGSVVEVQHKERATYLTVGSPIKFSDFTPEITASPLLGEHTDDVLTELGYDADTIAELHSNGVV